MPHTFANSCPTCGCHVPVQVSQIGRQVVCVGCGNPFVAVGPTPIPAPAPDPAPAPAATRPHGASRWRSIPPAKLFLLVATAAWLLALFVGGPVLALVLVSWDKAQHGGPGDIVYGRDYPNGWTTTGSLFMTYTLGNICLATTLWGVAMAAGLVWWFATKPSA